MSRRIAPSHLRMTYRSAAEILAHAHISTEFLVHHDEQLPTNVRITVATAKLCGLKPTAIVWPDGAFAVVILDARGTLPPASEVVDAYRACRTNGGMLKPAVKS
jgi:hypothetical protein